MPNTKQTKLLLAQSLQDLMNTVPLEKITVNDIVAHAGVGRNTFYYHFEDKYDLVNWYFQDGVTKFFVARESYSGWRTLLDDFACYFRTNKVFYTNALQYSGQNSLRECMYHYVNDLFRQRIIQARPELNDEELNFAANFFSGGIIIVLLSWIKGGMVGDVSDHYTMIQSLCSGDLMQRLLTTEDLLPLLNDEDWPRYTKNTSPTAQ